MIHLYQFPRDKTSPFPSYSPFCAKMEVYLRAAKVPYENHFAMNPAVGPKGKMPFVVVNGKKIGDSNFIIDHLRTEGVDLDQHLSPDQRAVSRAFVAMLEEHLVCGMLYHRWVVPESWAKFGPKIFAPVPALVRGLVQRMAQKKMKSRLHMQGMGRHSPSEILAQVNKDLAALDQLLSGKKFFFNQTISTLDCAAFGLLGNFLYDPADTPLKAALQKYPALVNLVENVRKTYFADLELPPRSTKTQDQSAKNFSSGK